MKSYSEKIFEAVNSGEHKILVKHFIEQFGDKVGIDSDIQNKLQYSDNGIKFSLLVYSTYLRYVYEFAQGKYNYQNFKNVYENFKYDSKDEGISFFIDPFGIKLEGLDYFNSLGITKEEMQSFISDLSSLLKKISYNISPSAIDSYLSKDSMVKLMNDYANGRLEYVKQYKTKSGNYTSVGQYENSKTYDVTVNKNNTNDTYLINSNISNLFDTGKVKLDNYIITLISFLFRNEFEVNYNDKYDLVSKISTNHLRNVKLNLDKLNRFNMDDTILSKFFGFKRGYKTTGFKDYMENSAKFFYETIDFELYKGSSNILDSIMNIKLDSKRLINVYPISLWYYYISLYSNLKNYMTYVYETAYGEMINTKPILPDGSSKSGYVESKNIDAKPAKDATQIETGDSGELERQITEVKRLKGKLGGDTGTETLTRGRGIKQEVANMQVGIVTSIINLGYNDFELNSPDLKLFVERNPTLKDDRFKEAFSKLNIINLKDIKKGDMIDVPSKLNDGIFGFRTEYLVTWFKLVVNDSILVPTEYKFNSDEINGIFDTKTRNTLNYIIDNVLFKSPKLETAKIADTNTATAFPSIDKKPMGVDMEKGLNINDITSLLNNGKITQSDYDSFIEIMKKAKI